MSRFLQHPLYTGKGLEGQWLNLIYSSHDLCCGCSTPINHLQHLLKCRGLIGTKEEDGQEEETPEEGFGSGDLEKLFEEPFTDEEPR